MSRYKLFIKKIYDNESKVYEARRPFMRTYIFQRIIEIVSIVLSKVEETGTVLNVGSGSGLLERSLTQHLAKGHIVSLDISYRMVKHLKKSDPKIRTVLADAEALPFRPRSFDLVIGSRVMKFVDSLTVIKAVRQIIKDGGFFIIIFDSGDPIWVKILERLGRPVDIGKRSRTLRTHDYSNALTNCNFEVMRIIPVTILPLSIFRYIPPLFYPIIGFLDRPVSRGRIAVILARPCE